MPDPTPDISSLFNRLGLSAMNSGLSSGGRWQQASGPSISVRSPIDGKSLAQVTTASDAEVDAAIERSAAAFKSWRNVPAPHRGQFVRKLGLALRERKTDLAQLITLENGKITQEALGEVQEMIDVCDFAVGLSRQLAGITIPSERPGHRLMEQWHPLGPVGVITAFNFPVAVWAWNAAIGLVCGDSILWKPSEKTPLTAIACHNIAMEVLRAESEIPADVLSVVIGAGPATGVRIAASPKLPLVSATGSVRMGKSVAATVGARLGKTLLELGGNGGMILAPSADLNLAVRAITFAAAGTAGQRCTTLRRLIAHKSIRRQMTDRLVSVFSRLKVGNPFEQGILVGPLIDEQAWTMMDKTLRIAKEQGGIVHGGKRLTEGVPAGGVYVRPAIVEMPRQTPICFEETFAPILYVMEYDDLSAAIEMHNAVPQGLSSAIFTTDIREAELFVSPAGSDCGMAHVNMGTSGAEIGAAFGGEKETGGGRESGSDAWKQYMRRTTNAINYSRQLPLAQGIQFDVD